MKIHYQLLIAGIFIILSFTGCKKFKIVTKTIYSDSEVSNIGSNSATVSTEILEVGENLVIYGYCYGTESMPTIEGDKTINTGENATLGIFTEQITDLNQNTKYYIRTYFEENEIRYGKTEQNFTTLYPTFITYGGSSDDLARSIQQTADGGFIVAGYSNSNDGDITGNHGGYDCWIVKLNRSGNITWQKSIGGSADERAYSILQITDGAYIVAGLSYSNDGDVTGNHGGSDYWIVKLDENGNIIWQKSLGGSGYDYARSIQQTNDGGYIVAGYSESNDGNVSGNQGSFDYWIVKLDENGNIVWQKSLGGSADEIAYSIQQTTDGGYIVAGRSESNDGNVSGNNGYPDYWIVKLNGSGNITWQKSIGGSADDRAYSIQQTTDGGYIVAGRSESNDGDVSSNYGYPDYWIVKLNGSGNITWQKSIGGSADDIAYSIQQTTDGGYIVAGYSESNNGNVSGNNGNDDFWIVKLNESGNIVWQKSLGGSGRDYAYSIQQTTDGGYIVAGRTESNDGNVTGNHGGYDCWIVKLDENGDIIFEN